MTEYGIKMPPEKKKMLQGRLQKRLKALNFSNFNDYVQYLFSPEGMTNEVVHMMDAVSTNKTDFFREPSHFEFLKNEALPELTEKDSLEPIRAWSAGCSSGEEPYTIAIVLSEFSQNFKYKNFSITASDISTAMLNKAANAIYHEDKIADLPYTLKAKYFLRSKNRNERKVRVIEALRNNIQYYRQNLLYLPQSQNPEFDLIFCRNVLIYFDRNNQYSILQKMCMQLKPGGYLFLGHSESIMGLELPLQQIKPTIFKKK
jgi:chemotaxis protein methyltransferase CheR